MIESCVAGGRRVWITRGWVDMAVSRRKLAVAAGAAVVVVGGAVGATVAMSGGGDGPKDLPCESGGSPVQVVSRQLCTALKGAGLPALLGVPDKKTLYQSRSSAGDPAKAALVSVEGLVGPYDVILERSKGIPPLFDHRVTVAGHPAEIPPPVTAKPQISLVVACDPKDISAGTYQVTLVWLKGDAPETERLRLAKKVAESLLPTLPDWRAS